MAQQKSILKLRGTIGGISFYKSKDGYGQKMVILRVKKVVWTLPESLMIQDLREPVKKVLSLQILPQQVNYCVMPFGC